MAPSKGIIVAGSVAGADDTSATTHTITYPTGIQAGDCLIMQGIYSGGPSTYTMPGWTAGVSGAHSNVWHYKQNCSGSETGTFTLTLSLASSANWVIAILRNVSTSQAPEGVAFTGSTGIATIDPAAVTPSWGSFNNIYLIGSIGQNTAPAQSISSQPSGYSNAGAQSLSINVATTRFVNMAYKIATSSTDDPGTVTYGKNVTSNNSVTTFAVKGL